MTGFSIDWLDLREAADRRARDAKLLQRARQWLDHDGAGEDAMTVVDLGAGTGSTLRAFASDATFAHHKLPHWHLVDQDTGLLAEASRRHGSSHHLQTHGLDLTDIAALPFAGARLVTASALFDLVSANFLDKLAVTLQNLSEQKPLGLYCALNYDGETHWTPAHPLDETVLSAFNRDQQRDKGFGAALGPNAGSYMERSFSSHGFTVLSAKSPWLLAEADQHLVDALITGIANAVTQDPALDAAELQDWVQFRKAHVASGTCIVGHSDLLALPNRV